MGAVPIALGFGADGSSRRPLGLVIVGGLIISQLVTLFVTAVICSRWNGFRRMCSTGCHFCAAPTTIPEATPLVLLVVTGRCSPRRLAQIEGLTLGRRVYRIWRERRSKHFEPFRNRKSWRWPFPPKKRMLRIRDGDPSRLTPRSDEFLPPGSSVFASGEYQVIPPRRRGHEAMKKPRRRLRAIQTDFRDAFRVSAPSFCYFYTRAGESVGNGRRTVVRSHKRLLE